MYKMKTFDEKSKALWEYMSQHGQAMRQYLRGDLHKCDNLQRYWFIVMTKTPTNHETWYRKIWVWDTETDQMVNKMSFNRNNEVGLINSGIFSINYKCNKILFIKENIIKVVSFFKDGGFSLHVIRHHHAPKRIEWQFVDEKTLLVSGQDEIYRLYIGEEAYNDKVDIYAFPSIETIVRQITEIKYFKDKKNTVLFILAGDNILHKGLRVWQYSRTLAIHTEICFAQRASLHTYHNMPATDTIQIEENWLVADEIKIPLW